ncbi:MAG: band 7 protein, partial [Planctomycetota bacterium]
MNNSINYKKIGGLAFAGIWFFALAYIAFLWIGCRVYVPEGHSLMLRYKGPLLLNAQQPAPGRLARDSEVGVHEQMRGPGRHFFNPLYWETTLVPDVVILPGEVGVVTCKIGTPLPAGEFLVDGDLQGDNRATQKGILRKVFGPGRYRANPYAYAFTTVKQEVSNYGTQQKHSGWVDIPTGYVGVVTMQTNDKQRGFVAGIQDKVLQPGLYPINPREKQVDILNVGYRESSIQVKNKTLPDGSPAHDDQGEPLAITDTGINFPSN